MRAALAFYSATWGRRPARGGAICDSLALAQKPYGKNVGIGMGGP